MKLFPNSCYGLSELADDSIDAVVADPPYGINYQNHAWDKAMPDPQIWSDALRVLRPGGFMLVFSAVRLQHRLTVAVEDAGFIVKDVVMWGYLNGMPKSRDLGLDIDKVLGVESETVGEYRYVQGYKKGGADDYAAEQGKKIKRPSSALGRRYQGFGTGIKPAYEPIVVFQKPLASVSLAQNVIQHGVGGLNLEETRLPYADGEGKVGHNPHPLGRVAANVMRSEAFDDGYDHFFMVPKVRQNKDSYNNHPTVKPVELMEQLIALVSLPGQTILDPFMGSGSTGIAARAIGRDFIGYEDIPEYFEIAQRRFAEQDVDLVKKANKVA